MRRLALLLALLTGTLFAQTTRTVNLSWTASTTTGVTYNVWRGATSAGPFSQLNTSAISGLTYADSTAVVGNTYTYYVTAYAGACTPTGTTPCGSSAPSPMVSQTIPPPPSAAGAITLTVP